MKNLKNIIVLLLVFLVVGCSSVEEREDLVTPPVKEVVDEKPVVETPVEEVEKPVVEEEKPEEKVVEPVKPVIPPKPKENPKKEIVIVGTADLHGRIFPYKYKEFDRDDVGGFARVATFVKKMRRKYPDMLLIDMGDAYFYEPFVKADSPSVVGILNDLKYDMMVMGNHELYMKNSYLMEEMGKFNGKAIVNNVYKAKDHSEGIILPSYAIFNIDGVRVAFTGSSIPQKGIRKILLSYEYDIADPLLETQRSVEEMEGKYDLLVGAFHLNKFGQDGDSGVVEVMEGVPQFDFAFNGHEHVDEGDWSAVGKHIIANNAYGITASYAVVKMELINQKWTVKSIEPHIVPLENLEPDPEFMKKYEELHQETIDYVDSGFHNWEKIYHKLHQYIIP
ncbi:hypothetical protein PM10SUCC1_21160 [Propionigenium maris DSM 9537]|uniref:Calcineurin-like phosphoesterase domain-containing protein n=1 Tax=Propionigenium maris DSM 9537 TaxID=1123000 RepID=A0A9W6GLS4_9FUSO|nr:metallophosphoesterase [Propionigenium maris]GLI56602.1 hypothetical protein PM10SUCC1_21160 [Propionigenium maris DSM 9537]